MQALAEARSKSRGFFQECSAIISAARRRAGLGSLSDADLQTEIGEWVEILAPIPDGRLHDCYLHAQRTRTVRAMLQPGELITAWQEIRGTLVKRSPAPADDSEACFFCAGTGWQTFAYFADSGNENTGVRPCACSKLPGELRSVRPFGAPDWRKRKHSEIFEKVQ